MEEEKKTYAIKNGIQVRGGARRADSNTLCKLLRVTIVPACSWATTRVSLPCVYNSIIAAKCAPRVCMCVCGCARGCCRQSYR